MMTRFGQATRDTDYIRKAMEQSFANSPEFKAMLKSEDAALRKRAAAAAKESRRLLALKDGPEMERLIAERLADQENVERLRKELGMASIKASRSAGAANGYAYAMEQELGRQLQILRENLPSDIRVAWNDVCGLLEAVDLELRKTATSGSIIAKNRASKTKLVEMRSRLESLPTAVDVDDVAGELATMRETALAMVG